MSDTPLAGLWRSFEADCLPFCDEDMKTLLRMAFYAGASAVFYGAKDNPTAEVMQDECKAFTRSLADS